MYVKYSQKVHVKFIDNASEEYDKIEKMKQRMNYIIMWRKA